MNNLLQIVQWLILIGLLTNPLAEGQLEINLLQRYYKEQQPLGHSNYCLELLSLDHYYQKCNKLLLHMLPFKFLLKFLSNSWCQQSPSISKPNLYFQISALQGEKLIWQAFLIYQFLCLCEVYPMCYAQGLADDKGAEIQEGTF